MKKFYKSAWLTILLALSSTALSDTCKNSDEVVINKSSEILGTPKNKLVVSKTFSQQNPAGDALDIIEIIMAIEDSLHIEINDKELDEKTGSSDVTELPNKLTIKLLQETAAEACKKHMTRTSSGLPK